MRCLWPIVDSVGVTQNRPLSSPFFPATGLGQRQEKEPAVIVVGKNRLTAVTAIHQMINGAGILQSQFTRHGERMSEKDLRVNS